MPEKTFVTPHLNLAAFIAVVLDYPRIDRNQNSNMITFEFADYRAAKAAEATYSDGGHCSAKALLAVRAFLFREVQRLTRGQK